jgi:hypothetical protein
MLISKHSLSLFRLATGFAIVGLLALSSVAAPPDGKGKGGGGGGGGGGGDEDPSQTLPNIQYDVRVVRLLDGQTRVIPRWVNNQRQMVGYQSPDANKTFQVGFLYDCDSDTVWDLESLLSADDYSAITQAGFVQSRFRWINDLGFLIGYVKDVDSTVFRSFILDLNTSPATISYPDETYPELNGAVALLCNQINNIGDVIAEIGEPGQEGTYAIGFNIFVPEVRTIGLYETNFYGSASFTDSGKALLSGFDGVRDLYDWTTNSVTPLPAGFRREDIAEDGRVVGSDDSSTPAIIEYVNGSWQSTLIDTVSNNTSGVVNSINRDGDLVLRLSTGQKKRAVFYHELDHADAGRLQVSDLVNPNQLDLYSIVERHSMRLTDRDETGFGTLWTDGMLLVPTEFQRN